MGRDFEKIKIRAAIHAAEPLAGDDGKRRAYPVIQGIEPPGLGVGTCTGVKQRRALAKRAIRRAPFEKGDDPQNDAEHQATQEHFHRQLARLPEKQCQGGDCRDQPQKMQGRKENRHGEWPARWQ